MKIFFTSILLGVCVTLTGCDQGTSGGPGASTPPAKAPMVGQTDDTFSMTVPSTKLNQGETKIIAIGISRGKNFSGDVSLKLGDLPKGVSCDPSSPVIMQADTDAKLTLRAAADAALGDFTVKVAGHPAKGADASSELRLTVAKQEPKETANATADAAKTKWDEYTAAVQTQWNQFAAKFAALKDSAAKAEGQAKTDLDKRLAEAQVKMDAAAVKMAELKSASADRWDKVKEGVSNAFDDLNKIFE